MAGHFLDKARDLLVSFWDTVWSGDQGGFLMVFHIQIVIQKRLRLMMTRDFGLIFGISKQTKDEVVDNQIPAIN